MRNECGFVFHHPKAHGYVFVPPVPSRYKVALVAGRIAVAFAFLGACGFCLAVAPVEFLSAAVPSFMMSLVILLRR